jgi:hypothetical protein
MWCQALSFAWDGELASGKIRWGPSMKTHIWSRQFIWRWLKPHKFTKKCVQVGIDCRVKFCSLHLTAPSHGMVLPLDLGLVACLHLLFAPFHSDSVRFVVHMFSVPRDSDQASPADIFMAEPYCILLPSKNHCHPELCHLKLKHG